MKPSPRIAALCLGSLLCVCGAQPSVAQVQVPYYAPPHFGSFQPNDWRAQNEAWQAQIDAWKAQQDAQNAQFEQPVAVPSQPGPVPIQSHSWPLPTTTLPAPSEQGQTPVAWRSPDPICERDPGRPGCEPGQGHAAPSYPRQPEERPSAAKVAAAVALTVLAVGVIAAIAAGPLITPAMFAGMKW